MSLVIKQHRCYIILPEQPLVVNSSFPINSSVSVIGLREGQIITSGCPYFLQSVSIICRVILTYLVVKKVQWNDQSLLYSNSYMKNKALADKPFASMDKSCFNSKVEMTVEENVVEYPFANSA